ncbi:unnamed protein product [Brassica rapa subsp. trilocularis]
MGHSTRLILGSDGLEALRNEISTIMIHCEWNSTLESIVEGVPLICRPFSKRAEDKRGILSKCLGNRDPDGR